MAAPLSPTEQEQLTRAFHLRDLREVPPAYRHRIASYLRELRDSSDPGTLLRQWFPNGPRFLDQAIHPENPRFPANHGYLLVGLAFQGANEQLAERLNRKYVEYLRKPHDLAAVVNSERLIRGLSQEGLAARAKVSPGDVNALEEERELTNPAIIRRILAALDIEASALPSMKLPIQEEG